MEVNLKGGRIYITTNWYFGGDLIECVDEYPYLGITFHYAGGFKLARKRLHNNALQAYHSILKNFSNVDRVPVKVLLKLNSCFPNSVILL